MRIKTPFVKKSAQDWSRQTGPNGGVFWLNARTGDQKYQQENPGGDASAAVQDATQQQQPQQKDPQQVQAERAAKIEGYATQMREKFGDGAIKEVQAMRERLKATPGSEARLAALDQVEAALTPKTPLVREKRQAERAAKLQEHEAKGAETEAKRIQEDESHAIGRKEMEARHQKEFDEADAALDTHVYSWASILEQQEKEDADLYDARQAEDSGIDASRAAEDEAIEEKRKPIREKLEAAANEGDDDAYDELESLTEKWDGEDEKLSSKREKEDDKRTSQREREDSKLASARSKEESAFDRKTSSLEKFRDSLEKRHERELDDHDKEQTAREKEREKEDEEMESYRASLEDADDDEYEVDDGPGEPLIKRINTPFVRKSAQDWAYSTSSTGHPRWTNNRTGDVRYQRENPGGKLGAPAQQDAPAKGSQPQQSAPAANNAKTQYYATQMHAKFGDQAGAKIDEMLAKVANDPAKVAALNQVKAELPKSQNTSKQAAPQTGVTSQPTAQQAQQSQTHKIKASKRAQAQWDKVFEGKIPLSEAGRLIGAPEGAVVTVSEGWDVLGFLVRDKGVTLERSVFRYSDGKLVMQNELIEITDKGGGRGTKIFTDQVDALVKAGFDRIETQAVRSENMNGYYTWARLGYDCNLKGDVNFGSKTIRAEAKKLFPNAKTVSDILRADGGKDWWKKNGGSFEGTFDLKEGSLSRRVLAAYVEEKKKERAMATKSLGGGEELELSPEDEAALDRAWARVRGESSEDGDKIASPLTKSIPTPFAKFLRGGVVKSKDDDTDLGDEAIPAPHR